MSKNKYSAGLVSKPFWFIEFKKTLKLIKEGITLDEIKAMNRSENIYGAEKEYRAKEIYNCVSGRAKILDKELIDIFCLCDLTTQKAIAMYAVMLTDRMLFEFMYEIYREKILMHIPNLQDSDIMIFFKNKQCQDKYAAKWTDCTLKKLKNSYINYLAESSFITDKNYGNKITPPLLEQSFITYLIDKKQNTYLYAMTGAR